MNKEEKKATRQSYGEELANLGEKNNKVVVLDADLSAATKTSIFAKKFPDRFFDMGIAEQNMIGTAAGLATCGKIPFASTFAMFAAGRAYDQIRNSICYPKLNVKICATHAGITVGEDGATHQMIEDISLMRTIPNMTVICTSDDTQTRWAVNEIAKFEGPVYLRLCRLATPKIYEDEKFEIGKGVQIGDGTDATIIATGVVVSEAIEAIYAHIPGIKVVIPSTPYDTKGLMTAAINDPDTVIFFEPKRIYRSFKQEIPEELYEVQIGKANVMFEGNDLTIVTYGPQVHDCLEAISKIKQTHPNVSIELIDLRTIKPMDVKTIIKSVKKTGKILVVNEAVKSHSVSAEIIALVNELAFYNLKAAPARVTG